jgi:nucleotide-binding universal stress UspA family protein
MITIKKILCPVDFYPASDAAVNYAGALAVNYDATVHLLHVIAPVLPTAYEFPIDTAGILKTIEERSAGEVKKIEARLKETGVVVESEIRLGDAYDQIKETTEVLKPDLVVLGTHGRRGVERWFMGSTTEKLLRHSLVPLLTIRATAERPVTAPMFRRILVTTDFSEGTGDALSYAFSVAQENDSRITLLHVLNDVTADVTGKYRDSLIQGVSKQLDDLVPRESRNWCDVVTRVETGLPYRIILRTIEDEKVDLLVMNIHGKGMLDRVLLGSNAERVVRGASCPVMLVPPMTKKSKRKARLPGAKRVAA